MMAINTDNDTTQIKTTILRLWSMTKTKTE